MPIGDYVRAQFESRWRRLLRADLEARTGSGDDGALRENVAALLQELVGLEPLLDADWAEQAKQHAEAASETTRPLQHTQRWLRILDLLATASTSPPVRVAAERLTGPVLAQELEAVVQTLLDQCRTLEPYSEDARWSRAHQLAGRAVTLSMLARDVFGKPAKQLRKHLSPISEALAHTLRRTRSRSSVTCMASAPLKSLRPDEPTSAPCSRWTTRARASSANGRNWARRCVRT